MRRALTLLLLVIPALGLASFSSGRWGKSIRSSGWGQSFTSPGGPSTPAAYVPLFAFAPQDGGGLPSIVADFCTTYAAEIEGRTSFCYRGDGGFLAFQADGGPTLALALSGTPLPVLETKPICSNGQNCDNVSELRWGVNTTTGTAEYASAAIAPTAGDFSFCTVISRDSMLNTGYWLGQDNSVDRGWYIEWLTSTVPNWKIINAGGGQTVVALPAATSHARHVYCGTYDAIGEPTSTMRSYMDGVLGNVSLSSAVLLDQTGTKRSYIGGDPDVANRQFNGTIGPTFVTEKLLTDNQITAMSHALLADNPTGTLGEVMTHTRASAMNCPATGDTSVTRIPTNRPCITRLGVYSEPAATNLAFRSEEIDPAAGTWAQSKTVGVVMVVTNDTTDVASPDGTYTAEKVVMDSVLTAGFYNRMYQAINGTASPYSFSLFLRTLTGTAEVNIGIENGSVQPIAHTRCQVTSTWSRCKVENITLTAAQYYLSIGTNMGVAGESPTIGSTTYMWGAQLETNAYSSSYIATLGSSATRALTNINFVKPAGFSEAEGCAAATVTVDGLETNGRVYNWASAGGMYFGNATSVQADDASNTAAITGLTSIIGRAVSPVQKWSGAVQTVTIDGTVSANATYDGALSATPLYLGSYNASAGYRTSGVITDVRVDTTTTGCGSGGVAPVATPIFEFATVSGVGLPSVTGLCDALPAASWTGTNKFCLNGDSTSAAGGLALTASGSPTTESISVCPNGPSCASRTVMKFDYVNDEYVTAASPSPTGDFSICAVTRRDITGVFNYIIGKDTGARAFYLRYISGMAVQLGVFKSGGTFTSADSATVLIENAWHLICATYDYVTDGTSVGSLYVDGTVSGTPNTTMVGPPTVLSSAYAVGGAPGSGFHNGAMQGAFFTETVLTPTQIYALARAVLADVPKSVAGIPMTFTRASAMVCPGDTDAEVTTVPTNRPCITRDGLYGEPAATNLLLRSEEFDNASWVNSFGGGPVAIVVTANSTDVAAPDGTYTAEKYDLPAVSGSGISSRYQAMGPTAGTYSYGVWLRTLTGTADVNIGVQNNTGLAVAFKRCSVTSVWSRCKLENAVMVGSVNRFFEIGTNLIAPAIESSTTAATVYVWGAQAEITATFLSSYIATASATATRAATVSLFPKPAGFSDASGCIAVTNTLDGSEVNGRPWSWTGGASSYFASGTNLQANDGTNTATASPLSPTVFGRQVSAIQKWSGSTQTLLIDAFSVNATYDGSLSGATFYVGSYLGTSSRISGVLKNAKVSTNPLGCVP